MSDFTDYEALEKSEEEERQTNHARMQGKS